MTPIIKSPLPPPVKNKRNGGAKARFNNQRIRPTHPIDDRLAELGKTRSWLAAQIGRSEQTISLYCSRKLVLWPSSLITKRICQVLGVNINFLILGLQGPLPDNKSQMVEEQPRAVTLLRRR